MSDTRAELESRVSVSLDLRELAMSHVEEVRGAVSGERSAGSQSLDDSALRPLLRQLARVDHLELRHVLSV
jgi:hypothetical protein